MEVLWVKSVSQISMSPSTQNVTLFGNKSFADVIKVRVKMSLKWTPNPLSVLIIEKKIHRDTQGRRVCEFHFSLFPPKPHTTLKQQQQLIFSIVVHNFFLAVCKPALYMAVVPQKLCSILLADAPAEHRLFLNTYPFSCIAYCESILVNIFCMSILPPFWILFCFSQFNELRKFTAIIS